MSTDMTKIGGGSAMGAGLDPAAEALARAERSRAKSEAVIAAIRDKGFRAYVEDMEREKLRALREKILEMMGLSEADLARMPAEQRAAVEKTVSEEIRRRLTAGAALERDGGEGLPGSGLGKGLAQSGPAAGLVSLLASEKADVAVPPTQRHRDETTG